MDGRRKRIDLQDFKPGLAANNPYPNILDLLLRHRGPS